MGLSRALLRGRVSASATSACISSISSRPSSHTLLQHTHPTPLAAAAAPPSVSAGTTRTGIEDEEERRRRLGLRPQSRAFHATRRHENPILIGVVIVVGATIARYVIRAARRVSKDPEGGGGKHKRKDDDEEEGAHAAGGAAGGGGSAHPARGFPVLGLDVGTLQSCVAFAASKTGAPLVVENHEGRRCTPAFVSFEEGALVVGQLAKRGRWREPARVGFNLPRLLGAAQYEDALRPLFPFPVEPPAAGHEAGGLVLGLTTRPVPSGEAAARVVEDLVQTAEHKSHELPRFAVLAVPSYFDAAAKARALKAAREGTGLEDVEVIEDAIATLACAHYTGRVTKEEAFLSRPWLVCDVGGLNAQFSVVQLDMEHGLVVRGHGSSWGVGGEQLDGALVRFLVEDFKKKHKGLDLGSDYLALERLHDAAEAAKVELSSKVSSNVRLPFITADHTGPKHLDATLSRAQLENLAAPLLDHLKAPFHTALDAAGLKPHELQGLILSGGTARLPFVPGFVAQLAKPAELPVVVLEAPEEAAALGSAFFGRELVDD
jgi:molecular chaperone DnaK